MKLIKPTQINEYQETKADRIIETVFIVGLSLILLILSVIILSTTVNAANDEGISNYKLPYYVDYYKGSYFDTLNIDSSLVSQLNNQGFWWFGDIWDNNSAYAYAYVYYPRSNSPFTISYKNHDLNSTVNYSDVNFASDYICLSGSFVRYSIRFDKQARKWEDAWLTTSTLNNVTINMCGRDSSSKNIFGFTTNVPYYLADNLEYYDSNNNLVFTNGVPIIPGPDVNTGHATEPTFDPDDNITSNGHAQQPNNPQYPQFIPPSIDTSTLETLVESLIDYVNEFADFVGECFSTFFAWLVEVIKNAIQSIINTIHDAVNFIYDNLVSLFEPTFENIGHAVEPVQDDEVTDAIENTDLYGLYSDFTSFTTTFDNAFDITEPDSFTITIHVEDITLLNQEQPYVLNLGSQFYPIRSALRTFLWILVTFGAVFFVEKNLSSWLKGSGEEK